MQLKTGTTRCCFLIGNWAIKIPKIRRWKIFLRGLLANIDESWKSKHGDPFQKQSYARVLFCSWWGLFLIMERVSALHEHEYDKDKFSCYFRHCEPIDNKIENFGRKFVGGSTYIVLVDYADSRYMCSDCSLLRKDK